MHTLVDQLNTALQPKHPHTSLEYMPGDTDVTIVVYSDDFERELFRGELTFSLAMQYVGKADRLIWDERDIDHIAFTELLAEGPIPQATPDAPTPTPAQAITCSIGDIVDSIYAEAKLSGSNTVTVTVGPATWLVSL